MVSNSRAVKASAEKQTDPDKPVLIRESTVEFLGVEYTIRADAFDDVEILEFLEDEKYVTVVRSVIGRDKWAEFKDSARNAEGRIPAATFEEFLNALMDSVGPTVTP